MHIDLLMYVLVIIHCQELNYATSLYINKYNHQQQQQLEQSRELEQQLINIPVLIFRQEPPVDSLISSTSSTTSGISPPIVDQYQEKETTLKNTIINKNIKKSKAKPLGRFLCKLWHRVNIVFYKQLKSDKDKESITDVTESNFKRYSLFVKIKNTNKNRGWIPERKNSKHSFNKKGKIGIGIWGR